MDLKTQIEDVVNRKKQELGRLSSFVLNAEEHISLKELAFAAAKVVELEEEIKYLEVERIILNCAA